MTSRFPLTFVAILAMLVAVAQTSTPASAAPVAYVFVSTGNPNAVSSLAVSSTGAFTRVSTVSSPTNIYHLSVTSKFLFGIDNDSNIYTYSIASNGALKLVATTNAGKYVSGYSSAYSIPLTQLDPIDATIYTMVGTSQTNWYLESFKIETNGELQFLGSSYADPNALDQIRFVQNGQYAVADGCYNTAPGASFTTDSNDVNDIDSYKHESTGFLTYTATSHDTPVAQAPYEYCAGLNASDSANHLAVGFTIFNPPGDDEEGGLALGTYTLNTSGNPSTTSDYENMPVTSVAASALGIDPTGKLLAVVGSGAFEVFHFNGANPITKYTGEIKTSGADRFVSWDKNSHMYILTDHSVDIYNITPTSYSELKPWEFTAPYGMIVLSLQ
jgi:hypothetical protein